MMSFDSPAPLAVILVAGIGQRLRPLTDDRPKALMSIDDRDTLLSRACRLLVAHGVREIVLATGYCEQAVREAMVDSPVPVHYCPNPRFESTQNSVSLCACEQVVAGRAFYKLDGDLLFEPEVLRRLDRSGAPLVAALDSSVKLGAEEMKVQLVDGTHRIAAFGKGLDPSRCAGESIGIERVGEGATGPLFAALHEAERRGETNLYYEDVYSRLIEWGLMAEAVPVGDLPWTEVDTAEDLARARALRARARN